jgi:uncharacterized membrane protein YccC
VALGAVVSLQLGSFVAPAMAYIAMQPTVTCTWRNLVRRVLAAVAAAVVLIHVGGVVVQLPWLLLPVFFIEVSAVSYFISLTSRPLEALAVMYSIVMVHFTGVFAPQAIGSVELEVVSAYAIGTAVGTFFAQLAAGERPRDRLAAELATSFRLAQARLRAVTAHYLDAVPAEVAPPPSLAAHLQLYDLVRQERLGPDSEAAFLSLMIAAERVHLTLTVAATLAAEPVGGQYRAAIAPELRALSAQLEGTLVAFADAAAERTRGEIGTRGAAWPDLPALIAALERHQLALRRSGEFARVDVAEGANTNAFAQALRSLAEIMHVRPSELTRPDPDSVRAAAPAWPTAARYDPYAARWAIQVGLSVTLTFVTVVVSHVPALFTAMWNPLFIAQSSYGATIRKAGLRVAGVVLGGVLALLTSIAVMPNITSVGALMLVFFVVILLCQYVALSGPRLSYAGMQTAFTYIIVLVADRPTADIQTVLWRAFGTLVGTAWLFIVFRLVAPDYAGRQVVARLRDLLAAILSLWPGATRRVDLSAAHLLEVRRDVGTAAADVLRLAEEARIEGPRSGIEPAAAVEAAGLASRIAQRSILIHRNRLAVAWPLLSDPTRDALTAVESAIREHLLALLRLLDARQTMAPTASRPHDAARRRAAALAARTPPDLDAPVHAMTERLEAVRLTELTDWPVPSTTSLFAEVDHLRRVGQLMPQLERVLVAACLPRTDEVPAADDESVGTQMATGPRAPLRP